VVAFVGVAAPARGDHVLPHVEAAATARQHVVDVLGRAAAVLAPTLVANEDAAAAERCAAAVGNVDVAAKAYDRWCG
jgi:hypothetical protein